jgi:hypothetical protein
MIKGQDGVDISLPRFRYADQGIVEPFMDFKVDNFIPTGGRRNGYYTFFLSHMHEGKYLLSLIIFIDHLKGLTRMSNGNGGFSVPDETWDYGTIYTSPTSKKLLLLRFPHLERCVVELSLYTDHTIHGRTVSLYEANHCPGAVMFLFNGVASKDPKSPLFNETFNVLHTGDFRFKNSMLKHFVKPTTIEEVKLGEDTKGTPEKQNYMEIDYLYMDNTFATHAESFPS